MTGRRCADSMSAVPVDQTLARVREDLAAGQTGRARQRLRGLVASFPERLDLRSMLAATYRHDGDAVQAGRWSYLDAEPDPAEVAAFLAAVPDPVARVRALRWRDGVPVETAGPVAAERLTALRRAAEEATGGPVHWQQAREWREAPAPTRRERLTGAVLVWSLLTALGVLLLLALVGGVVVLRWLHGAVTG